LVFKTVDNFFKGLARRGSSAKSNLDFLFYKLLKITQLIINAVFIGVTCQQCSQCLPRVAVRITDLPPLSNSLMLPAVLLPLSPAIMPALPPVFYLFKLAFGIQCRSLPGTDHHYQTGNHIKV
jgi:hypothetical protein